MGLSNKQANNLEKVQTKVLASLQVYMEFVPGHLIKKQFAVKNLALKMSFQRAFKN